MPAHTLWCPTTRPLEEPWQLLFGGDDLAHHARKVLQGLITKWCDDTRAGFGLVIDEHASVALMLGDGEGRVEVHGAGKPLGVRRWYFVAASYNAVSGRVRVDQRPLVEYPFSDDAASVETVANISVGGCPDVPLIVAAHGLGSGSPSPEIGGHYNGKIDGPRLYGRALTEQGDRCSSGGLFRTSLRQGSGRGVGLFSRYFVDNDPRQLF